MKRKTSGILLMLCFTLTVTSLQCIPARAESSNNYTLTGNYIDDVISVAVAQEGKDWDDLGDEMTTASNNTSYEGQWCGNFVWWCGYKAGLVSNGFFPSNQYFPTAVNPALWFAQSESGTVYVYENFYDQLLGRTGEGWEGYANAGMVEAVDKSFEPKKGDIIMYGKPQAGKNRVTITHTGYIRKDSSNGKIYTVEGNTGSGVKLRDITANYYEPTFLGYPIAYVRPNYPTSDSNAPSSNGLPTNLVVSTDKSTYTVGETVTITPSANNATRYAISVWQGDFSTGKRLYANFKLYGSTTFTPKQTGKYTIRADAKNGVGYISAEKTFTVVAKNSLPTDLAVTIDKSSYTVGETVTITPSANNVTHYAISIWQGDFNTGKRLYANFKLYGGITFTPEQAGKYTIRTDAKNGAGYISMEKTFTVAAQSTPAAAPSEGHWGPWSDWSTNHIASTDGRQVQTREVKISDERTEYRYGRFVDYASGKTCWCKTYLENVRSANGSATLEYSVWSTTRQSAKRTAWTCGFCRGEHVGVHHVGSDGRAWWSQFDLTNGAYYWEETRTVGAKYETQYSYREWIP